jgi:hypothetical protein
LCNALPQRWQPAACIAPASSWSILRRNARKPSYTREQLDRVLSALSSASAPSLSTIARAEALTKQTVYRIKADPRAAEAALAVWGL